MVSLRIASDLHLERRCPQDATASAMIPPDERDSASVLVLAGDISNNQAQLTSFLEDCKPRFAHVVFVPGNHEFYGSDHVSWYMNFDSSGLHGAFGSGVECHEIAGVRFVCGTLWGDGGQSAADRGVVSQMIADFRCIRGWTLDAMASLNRVHKDEISSILATPFRGPTVVVTHHLPSRELCHPRFASALSGGFASDCDALMKGPHAPVLWIHGHTHDTIDRQLHDTRVVCNPAGYPEERDSPYNSYGPKFVLIPYFP